MPATNPHTAVLRARLEKLAADQPSLAEVAGFYADLWTTIAETPLLVEPLVMDDETIRMRLLAGQPLLSGDELPFESTATRELFLRLAGVLVEKGGLKTGGMRRIFGRNGMDTSTVARRAAAGDIAYVRAVAAAQIRQAIQRGGLDVEALLVAVALGDVSAVEVMADDGQIDAALLLALARATVRPLLRARARGLDQAVLRAGGWQRGDCPVCGALAVLAEHQGHHGDRHLRCGVCGCDWKFPLLACPFCGNQDHRQLGQLFIEGENKKYSVSTCEQCRHYIKTLTAFNPTPGDELVVEDLATLHLDLIAAERGYTRAEMLPVE